MKLIYGKSADLSADFERALASYRYRIFIQELGWDLPVENEQERDQFDRPDTVYVATENDEGKICGCARLLPTTHPYLLGEVFPALLNGLKVPCSPEVWELSRFAAVDVTQGIPGKRAQFDGKLTKTLLAAALRCAEKLGAKRVITVSPLGIERLLGRMGVHAHRAGPPLVIDGYPLFACWIEIDDITRKALYPDETSECSPT